jgi:hypothetical protein
MTPYLPRPPLQLLVRINIVTVMRMEQMYVSRTSHGLKITVLNFADSVTVSIFS